MKELWFVISVIIGAAVFSIAVVMVCCKLAGELSREEEENAE